MFFTSGGTLRSRGHTLHSPHSQALDAEACKRTLYSRYALILTGHRLIAAWHRLGAGRDMEKTADMQDSGKGYDLH